MDRINFWSPFCGKKRQWAKAQFARKAKHWGGKGIRFPTAGGNRWSTKDGKGDFFRPCALLWERERECSFRFESAPMQTIGAPWWSTGLKGCRAASTMFITLFIYSFIDLYLMMGIRSNRFECRASENDGSCPGRLSRFWLPRKRADLSIKTGGQSEKKRSKNQSLSGESHGNPIVELWFFSGSKVPMVIKQDQLPLLPDNKY